MVTAQRTQQRPTVRDPRLDAEDRPELTEEGWVERVVRPPAGNMDHRVSMRLGRLGVPDECVFKATNLAATLLPSGKTVAYIPDAIVVLPDNPVPCEGHQDYPGVPDLVVEIMGGDPKGRRTDRREKRRNYALLGAPHYWIVDPDRTPPTVTWLRLEQGAYVEQWTRPLAEAALPVVAAMDDARLFAIEARQASSRADVLELVAEVRRLRAALATIAAAEVGETFPTVARGESSADDCGDCLEKSALARAALTLAGQEPRP